MRVNVYAEEMTDRIEIVTKEADGHRFTGLRFYLELPVTVNGQQIAGPFMHRPGDDDSSAVTFWGKRDLRAVLRAALEMLDSHYAGMPKAPEDTKPSMPFGRCQHCGEELVLRLVDAKVPTHDFPKPCRSVCPGSGQPPMAAALATFGKWTVHAPGEPHGFLEAGYRMNELYRGVIAEFVEQHDAELFAEAKFEADDDARREKYANLEPEEEYGS